MTSLPIQGKGLDAIIRDTLADPVAPVADPAQMALEKTVADKEI